MINFFFKLLIDIEIIAIHVFIICLICENKKDKDYSENKMYPGFQ